MKNDYFISRVLQKLVFNVPPPYTSLEQVGNSNFVKMTATTVGYYRKLPLLKL